MSKYKSTYTLAERQQQSQHISDRHPSKVPVIVYHMKELMINERFLVPKDFTIAQFMKQYSQKVHLDSTKSHIMFINNTLPCSSATLGPLYISNQDEDGFLYIIVTTENTFGA